jgi:hypothetical protein
MASQTVNSEYYCDVLWQLRENVQRLRPELWRQKNCLLHHNNALSYTSFFTREFLNKNNMSSPTHPIRLSLCPLTFFSVSHYFDAFEVIEAGSQVVRNTQNTTSRMHLKKWQKRWERCIRVEGDYLEGDGGQ